MSLCLLRQTFEIVVVVIIIITSFNIGPPELKTIKDFLHSALLQCTSSISFAAKLIEAAMNLVREENERGSPAGK